MENWRSWLSRWSWYLPYPNRTNFSYLSFYSSFFFWSLNWMEKYNVPSYPWYRMIECLNWHLIFTSNFDFLLFLFKMVVKLALSIFLISSVLSLRSGASNLIHFASIFFFRTDRSPSLLWSSKYQYADRHLTYSQWSRNFPKDFLLISYVCSLMMVTLPNFRDTLLHIIVKVSSEKRDLWHSAFMRWDLSLYGRFGCLLFFCGPWRSW
jgi:hypothetical protein